MTTYFDQRGQHVRYQFNAAGDINLSEVSSRAELVERLEEIQKEVALAISGGALPADLGVDVEYQLKKGAMEARSSTGEKVKLIDHLSSAKDVLEKIATTAGLVEVINKAIDWASKNLFWK